MAAHKMELMHFLQSFATASTLRAAAHGSLGSNDMNMMDADGVEYQVGAEHWGSEGCREVGVGTALTVRPPAYSHSCPGYDGWLGAKVKEY